MRYRAVEILRTAFIAAKQHFLVGAGVQTLLNAETGAVVFVTHDLRVQGYAFLHRLGFFRRIGGRVARIDMVLDRDATVWRHWKQLRHHAAVFVGRYRDVREQGAHGVKVLVRVLRLGHVFHAGHQHRVVAPGVAGHALVRPAGKRTEGVVHRYRTGTLAVPELGQGVAVQKGNVVALQVSIVGDLPVGTLQAGSAVQEPLVGLQAGKFVEHATQVLVQVEGDARCDADPDETHAFFTRQLHQAALAPVYFAEFSRIGHRQQRSINTETPGVVRADKTAHLARLLVCLRDGTAPMAAGVDESTQAHVFATHDQNRYVQHFQRLVITCAAQFRGKA